MENFSNIPALHKFSVAVAAHHMRAMLINQAL